MTGMTMTQKILAAHCGRERVAAGELVECSVDMALANDITAPLAIKEFRKTGATKVFDPNKIALVPDHFTPNKDIASAVQAKETREFAREMGIANYFEIGRMGIEHALLPEKGLVKPGDCIIGADSHTCTYGALGAFSTGVGSTDFASALALGTCWFKVPDAIKINVSGTFSEGVTGKDFILYLIGKIGVEGARYLSMEFTGSGVANISLDERLTIANMATEAGAKNGIFPVDELVLEYVKQHAGSCGATYTADDDAHYLAEYYFDLNQIPMSVAFPHLPENVHDIEDAYSQKIKVDQAVIGSCTNGRISDMRQAAAVLKGRTVDKDMRLIIIPATQEVWQQCVKEGLMDIFIEAGAAVSTPTCGPCLGGYMGILAAGERAIATTNRNFVGRMGDPKSEVYLSSPAVAAASAVAGIICGPQHL